MKISLYDVKKRVSSKIFNRGIRYYEKGAVEILENKSDYCKALVYGTYPYEVEIFFDKNGWYDATCTCPYWAEYKHIVATFFALIDYK